MKAFTLPIILGLLATVCHAAPSTAQPQARQVTTLIIDFFGAGANPPSYEIDVPLASSENFQSFNISESLSFFLSFFHHPPTQSGLLASLHSVFPPYHAISREVLGIQITMLISVCLQAIL